MPPAQTKRRPVCGAYQRAMKRETSVEWERSDFGGIVSRWLLGTFVTKRHSLTSLMKGLVAAVARDTTHSMDMTRGTLQSQPNRAMISAYSLSINSCDFDCSLRQISHG